MASLQGSTGAQTTVTVTSTRAKPAKKPPKKKARIEIGKKKAQKKDIPLSPAKHRGPPPKIQEAPLAPASPSKNTRSSPVKTSISKVCNVNHFDTAKWVERPASYWTEDYQVRTNRIVMLMFP